MLKLLREDVKLDEKIQIHLINGHSPVGFIREIGPNFLLFEDVNGQKHRYFEQLIGGWGVPSNQPANKKDNFHKDLLLNFESLANSLIPEELELDIKPNAKIIDTAGNNFIALSGSSCITLLKNSIYDDSLLSALSSFDPKTPLPVWLLYGSNSESILALAPQNVKNILSILENHINKKNYSIAKNILWVFRENPLNNVFVSKLIAQLVKIKTPPNQYSKKIRWPIENESPIKQDYSIEGLTDKELESLVNKLIRSSEFKRALFIIEDSLKRGLPKKYKSSFLLKKAQIFSSLNSSEKAEEAYQNLIEHQETIKASSNNLSHLYQELARLQAIIPEKRHQANISLEKALKYNPNNRLAEKLLSVIHPNASQSKSESSSIAATLTISKMLEADIKEHKFTYPKILKNNEKPTAYLAEEVLKKAWETREASKYPLYLEAAKAFSELNPGSYDSNDYYESIAFYSMLKGDSIFSKFKSALEEEADAKLVTRLRDSASSYYLEALNLMTNVSFNHLLHISGNYIKLQLGQLMADQQERFSGDIFNYSFEEILRFSINNDSNEIKKIITKAIVDIGSQHKEALFKLTSKLGASGPIISFPQEDFAQKSKEKAAFEDQLKLIAKIAFEPENFTQIHSIWFKVFTNSALLNDTDIEIKDNVEKIVSILQPYLNRNNNERTHLLLQAKSVIEKQTDFINENTTYYGRTFFYDLLVGWEKSLNKILAEKLTYDLPNLVIEIDPSYYLISESKAFAPLTIKNIGKTTASGYEMSVRLSSPEQNIPLQSISKNETVEIANESQTNAIINIPFDFVKNEMAVELRIDIVAVYQDSKVNPQSFVFTLEKEPKTKLISKDIPWQYGKIPPEHLFKGRQALIDTLKEHYLSEERNRPYILYGLTRTGKSSILKYLGKEIRSSKIDCPNGAFELVPFQWNLQYLANANNEVDFYYNLMAPIFSDWSNLKIDLPNPETSLSLENLGFTQFKDIIFKLNNTGFFPFFVIDEFSFMKDLIDKKIIGPAFLAALRDFSLENRACFIFAGTYEIKQLVKNEKYGITGQFVHTISYQVDKIDDQSAEELIQVVDPQKLVFTKSAINHIKLLSGNIPYFIQMICKACGDYAVNKQRRYVGYPELEKVINIMTSTSNSKTPGITSLTEETFQNNQFFPSAPIEELVLISSIAFLNKGNLIPLGVRLPLIEDLWRENKMISHIGKLVSALESLLTKKILYSEDDEGGVIYKFSVDLFRRWWYSRHKDIRFEISKLAVS